MDKQQEHLTLADSLRDQLQRFTRRLRLVETLGAVTGAICGLLATYVLLFLSDRLWETPVALRFLFTASGTLLAVGFGWYWARRWVLHRRNLRDVALMVQQQFPRLGDRLLGIVEPAAPPVGDTSWF